MPARTENSGKSKSCFVYILQCSDGTYYTGYTPDLERRVARHNNGRGAKYTRGRVPVKLVYARKYASVPQALREERRIKGLTRGQKERLLVNRRRREQVKK
ncbi:MAG: GIY-YIG nuclease family protein [Candidatus Omnitrophica bacterium]|nr:GIY-YIG nuclease family protein [Candidatus Omnitrophota bacterium]